MAAYQIQANLSKAADIYTCTNREPIRRRDLSVKRFTVRRQKTNHIACTLMKMRLTIGLKT